MVCRSVLACQVGQPVGWLKTMTHIYIILLLSLLYIYIYTYIYIIYVYTVTTFKYTDFLIYEKVF